MMRTWRQPVWRLAQPVPMMKLGATFAVAGIACGMLWLAGRSSRQYYQEVAEVLANPEKLRGRRVAVRGYVGCGSIQRRVGTDHYRFEIADTNVKGAIEARYTGPLPDFFESGRDVVVKGRLCADGSFDVIEDGIILRCPNKYDGPWPGPQTRCPSVSSVDGDGG
jgi:cytochrome c-type biogenesis protein CcmE